MFGSDRRPPCYCGGTRLVERRELSRASGLAQFGRAIVMCESCGQVTRSPSLFEDQSLQEMVPITQPVAVAFVADNSGGARRIARRLRKAAGRVDSRRLLDVGAGSGATLRLAREMGWDVVGVETDSENRAKVLSFGIKCVDIDLCVEPMSEYSFDVIHMSHVLEHVRNPLSCLMHVAQMLSEKGVVVIEVPNEHDRLVSTLRRAAGVSYVSQTSLLEHEWFFTPKTLRQVLVMAGLRVQHVGTPAIRGTSLARHAVLAIESAIGQGSVIEAWASR